MAEYELGRPYTNPKDPSDVKVLELVDGKPVWRQWTGWDTASDVAKSTGIGLARGAAAVIGAPADLTELAQRGIHKAGDFLTGYEPTPEDLAYRESTYGVRLPRAGSGRLPNTEDVRNAAYELTGITYDPKTKAGEWAETAGEVAPAVAAGPGSVARKVATTGLMTTGVAGGGDLAEAVGGEDARPIGETVGGLVAGLGSVAGMKRSGYEGLAADAVKNVTPAQFDAAQRFVDDAAKLGVEVTTNEALQFVTKGGTRLSDLMRVVEQSRRGSQVTNPFYAMRAEQLDKASKEAIDAIAPPSKRPSATDRAVNEAAINTIDNRRKAINRVARRQGYDVADKVDLPFRTAKPLLRDPVVRSEIRDIRSDPFFRRRLGAKTKKITNVELLDQVRKNVEKKVEAASNPMQTDAQVMAHGAEATRVRQNIRKTLSDAVPEYKRAMDTERDLRSRHLDPLTEGPAGRLSKALTFDEQADIILPTNPRRGTEFELTAALKRLKRRDPDAFRQLAADRIQQVFNKAIATNMSGPNQWRGAKFNKALRGNGNQGATLEATVRALGGDRQWEGLQRVLDIGEATGYRQVVGSRTAFNQELMRELEGTGFLAGATEAALSPSVLMRKASDTIRGWSYGRNTEALARLLTSPDGVKKLKYIASLDKGSAKARAAIVALIVGMNAGD